MSEKVTYRTGKNSFFCTFPQSNEVHNWVVQTAQILRSDPKRLITSFEGSETSSDWLSP